MDELERFKSEINLTAYAASRGYRVDRRESSRNSVVMRHPSTDDKIIVSRGEHDQHWVYFSVRDSRDHGTIVDFVQQRDGGTLGAVRGTLLSWIGGEHPSVSLEFYVGSVALRRVDRGLVARVFQGARVVTSSAYLNTRGIRTSILSSDRFVGTFREDRRGNVLFPHRDDAGSPVSSRRIMPGPLSRREVCAHSGGASAPLTIASSSWSRAPSTRSATTSCTDRRRLATPAPRAL
jgi:hypothetical protein